MCDTVNIKEPTQAKTSLRVCFFHQFNYVNKIKRVQVKVIFDKQSMMKKTAKQTRTMRIILPHYHSFQMLQSAGGYYLKYASSTSSLKVFIEE